jgi:aspartokinase
VFEFLPENTGELLGITAFFPNILIGMFLLMRLRTLVQIEKEETAQNSIEAFKEVFVILSNEKISDSLIRQQIVADQKELTTATKSLVEAVTNLKESISNIYERLNIFEEKLDKVVSCAEEKNAV